MISFITIISSNDVIILTFTPFICYFCKEMKVNPIPYLFMEFVAANTWSTLLIIGNPTNIYIATMQNINFISYLSYMLIPTIVIVGVSFLLMILLFSIIYNLTQPTNKDSLNVVIADNNTQEGSSTPYQVKIIYNGTWYAKYGDPNYLQEKSGSGGIVISLDCAAWDAVHVSVQKTDASSENLTVQILRNGEVVAVNSTTSPNGGVKLNYQN